jgi:hypothetical protein
MDGNKKLVILVTIATIITLMILNIFGVNGILSRHQEEKTMLELSNIMKDIEENISEIKAQYGDVILTSGEMLKLLEGRGLLTLSNTGVMQGSLTSKLLDNLIVNYDGDVYLNNYKRGEVSLSSKIDNFEYQNPFNGDFYNNIKVIDGNIEERDGKVWICALEGRKDFACWINEYGEIVSIEENMPFSYEAQSAEYIAIYNDTLKEKFANKYVINTTANVYIDKEDTLCFNVIIYNYYNRVQKNGYLLNSDYNYTDAFIGKTNINSIGIYFSDNSESLIELSGSDIVSYCLSDLTEPEVTNFSDGLSLSVLNCTMDLNTLKASLEEKWGTEIDRLYYRAGVDANYFTKEGEVGLTTEEALSFCLEPAIKYIDFQ